MKKQAVVLELSTWTGRWISCCWSYLHSFANIQKQYLGGCGGRNCTIYPKVTTENKIISILKHLRFLSSNVASMPSKSQRNVCSLWFFWYMFLLAVLTFYSILKSSSFPCICKNSKSQEDNSSWHVNPVTTTINYLAEWMLCSFLWSCSIFVCEVEMVTWENHHLILQFTYTSWLIATAWKLHFGKLRFKLFYLFGIYFKCFNLSNTLKTTVNYCLSKQEVGSYFKNTLDRE